MYACICVYIYIILSRYETNGLIFNYDNNLYCIPVHKSLMQIHVSTSFLALGYWSLGYFRIRHCFTQRDAYTLTILKGLYITHYWHSHLSTYITGRDKLKKLIERIVVLQAQSEFFFSIIFYTRF